MMAAVSPILVNSSSPLSLRSLATTPPSLQRTAKDGTPSSPQLPSPSTFVRRRNVTLENGSREQKASEGVKPGSASVDNFLKDNELRMEPCEEDKNDAGLSGLKSKDAVMKADEKVKGSRGKLVKPKKMANADESANASRHVKSTGLDRCETTKVSPLKAAMEKRPNVYDFPTEHASLDSARKVGENFSEYAIDGIYKDPVKIGIVEPPKQAKKPRKRAPKAAEGSGASMVTNPKKRKPKSQKIILNSDDPDPKDETVSAHFSKHGNARAKSQPEFESTGTHIQSAQHDEAFGRSIYFARPIVSVAEPSESTSITTLIQSPTAAREPATVVLDNKDVQSVQAAPRRRRSWTPIKDTEAVPLSVSRPPTADSAVSDTSSCVPKLQLRDILGKFGYAPAETDSPALGERTPDGESVTKRRRIVLVDAAMGDVVASKSSGKTVPKRPKTAKEPKKKAPTITALATAAFQPTKEILTAEAVVSAHLSPLQNTSASAEHQPAKTLDRQTAVVKQKKPRKSRAKSHSAENATDSTVAPTKSKKTSVPRNRKAVKLKEANERSKLYPPTVATAQIQKQEFLFGTSSQLAPPESPEHIQHLQSAFRESEEAPNVDYHEDAPSQVPPSSTAVVSPLKKSCARVPTAPHGTCLSIEQASRALWCRAARDSDGNLLRIDEENEAVAEDPTEKIRESASEVIEIQPSGKMKLPAGVTPKATFVDLCTSPLAPTEKTSVISAACEQTAVQTGIRTNSSVPMSLPIPLDQDDDDTWMIIRSDNSSPGFRQCDHEPPPSGQFSPRKASQTSPTASTAIKSPSPRMFRPALRPLDSNAGTTSLISPLKPPSINHVCAMSSKSPREGQKTTRRLEHPAEDSHPLAISSNSPRKRGRPRKIPVTASSPPAPKLKNAKYNTSTYQATSELKWLDIDEISDSDPPITPSPPRRRPTSSPPAMQPLILSPSNLQNAKGKAPAASRGPVIKPDEPQWPATKTALFSAITTTIKSMPRSTDPATPSWWEKVLLYDPIVVEDLTVWLNEQGLRAEIRRRVAKKGKKRKADAEQNEGSVEVEFEIHDEPLQPWMVQKWCEEKSVCCYTKDGGWRKGR